MDPAATLTNLTPSILTAMRDAPTPPDRQALLARAGHLVNSLQCHVCQRPATLSHHDLTALCALAALATGLFPDTPKEDADQ